MTLAATLVTLAAVLLVLAATTPAAAAFGSLTVTAHLQTYNWTDGESDGAAGLPSENKRVEALIIELTGAGGGVEHAVYMEGEGRLEGGNGSQADTTGQSASFRALKVALTGTAADAHDVWYRVWWTATAGSAGRATAQPAAPRPQAPCRRPCRSCTPGKGSAIFLRCLTGGSTAGCVAIPQSAMITVPQNVTADCAIVIDHGSNIANY